MKLLSLYFIITFIVTSCASTAPSNEKSFWKLENIDASKERVKAITEGMTKCEAYLSSVFNVVPSELTVIAYGSMDSFIGGLKDKLGYSDTGAERFRTAGTPKPARGLYLLPPNMSGRFFCHEIAHKYIEVIVEENTVSETKWFEEGAAEYFSVKAFKYDLNKDKVYWKKHKGLVIPLGQISTRESWNQLFNNKNTQALVYLQARSMFTFFIEKFGTSVYFELLVNLNDSSFEEAFHQLTGMSVQTFFNDWQNSL